MQADDRSSFDFIVTLYCCLEMVPEALTGSAEQLPGFRGIPRDVIDVWVASWFPETPSESSLEMMDDFSAHFRQRLVNALKTSHDGTADVVPTLDAGKVALDGGFDRLER